MRLLMIDVLLTAVSLSVGKKLIAKSPATFGRVGVAADQDLAAARPSELARAEGDLVLDEVAPAAHVRRARVHAPRPAARHQIAQPAGILAVNRLASLELPQHGLIVDAGRSRDRDQAIRRVFLEEVPAAADRQAEAGEIDVRSEAVLVPLRGECRRRSETRDRSTSNSWAVESAGPSSTLRL